MSALRRVLVVAYYFPPLGGGGVQRTLNFVRYLPDFGWQPVVLTAGGTSYRILDESLSQLIPPQTPVIRTEAWSPTDFYFRTTRRPRQEGGETGGATSTILPGWVRHLGRAVLQATMLPDDKVGWALSAARAGAQAIAEHGVDALYSTAPPFRAHQIGRRLARQTGRPWVADFRDQFVGRYNELFLTGLHRWIGRRMERRWISAAQRVISTSWRVSAEFAARYPNLPGERWVTITNGYDEGDFAEGRQPPATQFCLRYLGSLYRAGSPSLGGLMGALASLMQKQTDLRQSFRLEFIGMRDIQARQDLEAKVLRHGLQDMVTYQPPISHSQAVAAMQHASALLLLLTTAQGAAGIIPAKAFEYLRAGRPILALVPPGETSDLVERFQAGKVAHPEDAVQIEAALESLISDWRRGALGGASREDIEQFERRALAGRLAAVLNEAILEGQR